MLPVANRESRVLDQTLTRLTGMSSSEGWEALVLGGPGFLGFRVSLLPFALTFGHVKFLLALRGFVRHRVWPGR